MIAGPDKQDRAVMKFFCMKSAENTSNFLKVDN